MHGIWIALLVFASVFNASVVCNEPVTKSTLTNSSLEEPMQMEISPSGRLSPRARAMLQSKMERKATKTKRSDRSIRTPAPTPVSKAPSAASDDAHRDTSADQSSQRTAKPEIQVKVKEPIKISVSKAPSGALDDAHRDTSADQSSQRTAKREIQVKVNEPIKIRFPSNDLLTSTSEEPSINETDGIFAILYEQKDGRPGPPGWALALLVVTVLGICWKMDYVFGYETDTPEETSPRPRQESHERRTEELPEDMHGVIIGCILWDAYCLEASNAHKRIRLARTAFVACLHCIGLFLQIALLFVITYYSAAQAVHDIRDAYSQYEKHMYGSNVYQDEEGFFHGKGAEHFIVDNFAELDEGLKSKICRIPFSQPFILMLLLFLWSLCVLGDVKLCYELIDRLVWNARPCSALMENEKEDASENSLAILKLPRNLKLVIGFGIVLPRVIVDGILLWLGCRWLAATPDFGNLVLNSVGLEFVLNLPQVSYKTIVSHRNKRDAKRVTMDLSEDSVIPSPHSFFVTTIWGIAALMWTIAYIFHIQQVLPDYRWDVRAICTNWMLENT